MVQFWSAHIVGPTMCVNLTLALKLPPVRVNVETCSGKNGRASSLIFAQLLDFLDSAAYRIMCEKFKFKLTVIHNLYFIP